MSETRGDQPEALSGPRKVGWSGASAITCGFAVIDFVKEILFGDTVARAATEASVFLVGGLIFGVIALISRGRAAGRGGGPPHR